jgi:hypothetical protein
MVLATYLRGQGWSLPETASEADVTISRGFKPGDIVVSQDSDMTAYENVETIWRPLSRKRFLKYEMAVVAKHHLQLSRMQLTVLCCVSKNYTTNLNQMGILTNYGIIKTISEDGNDPDLVFIVFSCCHKPSKSYIYHIFFLKIRKRWFVGTWRIKLW